MTARWLVAVVCALATFAVSNAARAQITEQVTSERGATIIVFPKIEVSASRGRDTIIQIQNEGNSRTNARCFYRRGDDQSCTVTEFMLELNKQQPTHWLASEGRAVDPDDPQCSRVNHACTGAGLDPGPLPPLPPEFVGYLICVEITESGEPNAGNHLAGVATLRSRTTSEIAKYAATGILADPNFQLVNPLPLDDVQLSSCPASWNLNHATDGSADDLVTGVFKETSLTILPCTQLLNGPPTSVDVDFAITDEFEQSFSATTTVSCWLDASLSSISPVFASAGSPYVRTQITTLNGGIFVLAEERRVEVPVSSAINLHRDGSQPPGDQIVLP